MLWWRKKYWCDTVHLQCVNLHSNHFTNYYFPVSIVYGQVWQVTCWLTMMLIAWVSFMCGLMDLATTPITSTSTLTLLNLNTRYVCTISSRNLMQRLMQLHTADWLVLSCPYRWCEQNWQQGKTVGDGKFRNCFVQSQNEERTIENSLDLSPFLSTPPTRQDSLVLFCSCRWCVRHNGLWCW